MAKEITKKNNKRIVIVLAFILLVLLIGYIYFRGQYLEILEIGEKYTEIFWQNVKYTAIAFSINFIVLFLLIYLTNLKIKKGLKAFFEDDKKPMPKLVNKSIAFISSIIISALTTNIMLKNFMLCFNSASFEIADPIFGYDISYFIFQKPFIEFMLIYILLLVVGLTIYTVIYYIISFNIFFDGVSREILRNSHFTKQLVSHIIIIVILLASLTYIGIQDMEVNKFLTLKDGTSYSIYGAGFADVTIRLWGYKILTIVMVVSIILAVIFFKKGKTKNVIKSLLVVPTYLIGMLLVLLITQTVFVNPNELDKEKSYITKNIEYTKKAYGIEIDEITISNNVTLDNKIKNKNQEVIDNIAITSKENIVKSLNLSQTAKGYYSYRDSSIAKIDLNGKLSLVYITPREISENVGTYNDKMHEYTHGYGVIVTSAKEVNEDGEIINLQKSFENNEVINISEPRIYYGLQTNEPVITNSKNKNEFDYPKLNSNSAENVENSYNGKAGLKLNFLDRFILGIKEGNLELAFSTNITKESKVLTNRNIIKRAKTLIPYLIYDENPYLVIDKDGKMIWVIDACTTSSEYPYSQISTIQMDALTKKDINYIRNSVKVLIDAYDGTTKFYITDRTDPIIMSYRNIYPNLFVDKDEQIPEDISSQFIYPEFLYNIQAEIIKRYHNIQPDVLYRGDDIWNIATSIDGKTTTKTGVEIEPYYTMVKPVDSETTKLGLVIPYTPYKKQNIISYAIGTYENGIPKLTIYKYTSDSNVIGTMQLNNLTEQDTNISKEIDKLKVTGTKITKRTIVVPIEDTLLYVQSIYQQYTNEDNSLPLLKKVVVASGNKFAIGDNIEEAINNLLSQSAFNIEIESTETINETIEAIIKANENLEKSNNSNDWEMIGKDMKKLQELIKTLEELVKQEEKSNKNKQTLNTINE